MSGFWTPHLVGEHLVQAFRSFPSHAVFSASRTFTSFEDARFGAHPSTADAFSWAPRFLDAYPKARLHLFSWARCKAQKVSFADLCRDLDWAPQTVRVSRLLAATVIADGLNAEALRSLPQTALDLAAPSNPQGAAIRSDPVTPPPKILVDTGGT